MKKNEVDTNLEDSKFYKYVGNLVSELLRRRAIVNKTGNRLRKVKSREEERDNYIMATFLSTIRILHTCEELEFVPIFIRRFGDKKFLEKNNINRIKYTRYHLENHFIKVSTLFDQLCKLVSIVYRLGIPEKRVNYNNVKENSHTKDSESIKYLKTIEEKTNEIKRIRNIIVHHGKHFDKDLHTLDSYFTYPLPHPNIKILEPIVKKFVKVTVNKQVTQVSNYNKELLPHIKSFLDTLLIKFTETEKILGNKVK